MCFCLVMAWFACLDGGCQQLRVQWRVSFPQQTTFHLEKSIWPQDDSDPSKISTTSTSKHSIGQGTPRCIIDDDKYCLIWHTPRLCMCLFRVTRNKLENFSLANKLYKFGCTKISYAWRFRHLRTVCIQSLVAIHLCCGPPEQSE